MWRIWKWKEKRTKKIDLPERWFEPQIFSNFPAHDLNFHWKWGRWDQIKTWFDLISSKHASKKDRTLLSCKQSVQPSKSLMAVLLSIPFNTLPWSTLTHHKDISDCNFPSSLGVFCGNFCYLLCANPWPNYVHCTLVPVGLLSFYLGGQY